MPQVRPEMAHATAHDTSPATTARVVVATEPALEFGERLLLREALPRWLEGAREIFERRAELDAEVVDELIRLARGLKTAPRTKLVARLQDLRARMDDCQVGQAALIDGLEFSSRLLNPPAPKEGPAHADRVPEPLEEDTRDHD